MFAVRDYSYLLGLQLGFADSPSPLSRGYTSLPVWLQNNSRVILRSQWRFIVEPSMQLTPRLRHPPLR